MPPANQGAVAPAPSVEDVIMSTGEAVRNMVAVAPTSENNSAKERSNALMSWKVDPKFRTIWLNNDVENERLRIENKYKGNHVATSKYTMFSFVPKVLLEFFRVTANCYFLLISILQVATTWSPTNRYTTAGPLAVVLMVSMIKQAIEDLKRHDADQIQNSRKCNVLGRRGEIIIKEWQEIQVGDILRLRDHEEAPADIFVLSTSEEEGRCYVETCNLDGETNLKRRSALEQVARHIGYRKLNDAPLDEKSLAQAASRFSARMEYELPNNRLYNFQGKIIFGPQNQAVPIGPTNIILRGCSVRSCAYIYGVIIFAGHETKLMQNARATPFKQSNVYRMVNRCILLVFVTQVLLCLVSTISNAIWLKQHGDDIWYFDTVFVDRSSWMPVVNFFTFVILYNNLVPISLYVSLDMVKVIQAKFISSDPAMCHEGTFAAARTSDLNEELGQVEYIFSDKTGTLTRNIMEFRKCFIDGVIYGFGTTEVGQAAQERSRRRASSRYLAGNKTTSHVASNIPSGSIGAAPIADLDAAIPEPEHDPRASQVHLDPSLHFDDPRLIDALDNNKPEAVQIDHFMSILAVCHTVIPEVNRSDGSVTYRASSPDEEALVKAAKCLGYNFTTPAPFVEVQVTKKSGQKEIRNYTVLNVNEFDSTRKRMSVVVRTNDNRLFLFCKGADNVMIPLSRRDDHTRELEDALIHFGTEGLRTLVIASRELTNKEYEDFDNAYQKAATSLSNRDDLLAEVAASIEQDMNIVGATAIEDKLQEGVPGAIQNLGNAGIKIWMLTGDKEETAINIGHACRLINEETQLLIISKDSRQEVFDQINALYDLPVVQECVKSSTVSKKLAIVCDGKSLVHVFPSFNNVSASSTAKAAVIRSKLLKMASVCRSLIACRVSPAQKAEIVNLVRLNLKEQRGVTLAIGDGANDVNMIQSAHVGIGVSGQEGVQAVNASDYSIAQFRFLERLLLVHGRFNYRRISKVILYSFYKNVALVIALFLYNFYNGQSGTSVFESFVMAGWNFFLAMPIICIGIFDEDVSPRQAITNGSLYTPGQRNSELNVRTFMTWILNAVIHAVVAFVLTMEGYKDTENHALVPLYAQGTLIYATLLMSANIKVIMETLSWNKFHWFFIIFSVCFFFSFLIIAPSVSAIGSEIQGVTSRLLGSRVFWLAFMLVPFSANLVDIVVRYVNDIYFPSLATILREKNAIGQKSAQIQAEDDHRLSGYTPSILRSIASVPQSIAVTANGHLVPRIEGLDSGNMKLQPRPTAIEETRRSGFYSGFAFSAPEGVEDNENPGSETREITSMRVMQYHEEQRVTASFQAHKVEVEAAAAAATTTTDATNEVAQEHNLPGGDLDGGSNDAGHDVEAGLPHDAPPQDLPPVQHQSPVGGDEGLLQA